MHDNDCSSGTQISPRPHIHYACLIYLLVLGTQLETLLSFDGYYSSGVEYWSRLGK